MAKPTHQWETRLHRASRLERSRLDPRLEEDQRAEAFELAFADRRACVSLGLALQIVDGRAWRRDPDLHAALCAWLIARGARSLRVIDEGGVRLASGPIHPARLHAQHGDPDGQGLGVAPVRLITLCPSAAELVHALGAFDRVIACEDSSDFPREVEMLERLGPDLGPDLDRVAQLKPDLVISSLSVPGMERVVSGLHARGLRQFVSAPRSIEDVRGEMQRLSELLGQQTQGRQALATFDAEREALLAGRTAPPRRVFLEWWPRPIFTPGRDCYSNELIELAGGVNVCGDQPGSSFEISPGQVAAYEPEIYFVSWCGVAADKLDTRRVLDRPGFEALEVVKKRRVFPLDEAFAGRPGPRMLEAARIMAKAIRSIDVGPGTPQARGVS